MRHIHMCAIAPFVILQRTIIDRNCKRERNKLIFYVVFALYANTFYMIRTYNRNHNRDTDLIIYNMSLTRKQIYNEINDVGLSTVIRVAGKYRTRTREIFTDVYNARQNYKN